MADRIKVEGGKVYIDGQLRLEATADLVSPKELKGLNDATIINNLFRYETGHEDAAMAGMFLSRRGLVREPDGVWRQRPQGIGTA